MHTTYSIAFFSALFSSAKLFISTVKFGEGFFFLFNPNVCVLSSHSPKTIALLQIYDLIMNILYGNCMASMHCCHNANSFRNSHTSIYVNFMVIFIDTHKLRATTGKFKNNDPFRQRVNFLSYTQSTRSNLVFDKNNKEIEHKYGSRLQIA